MKIRKIAQVLTVLFSVSLALVFIGFQSGFWDRMITRQKPLTVIRPEDTIIAKNYKPNRMVEPTSVQSHNAVNEVVGRNQPKKTVDAKPKKLTKKELKILYSSKSIFISDVIDLKKLQAGFSDSIPTKPRLNFDTSLLKRPKQNYEGGNDVGTVKKK